MKLHTKKCHLLVLGHKHENCWARVGSDVIWEDSQVKLLGVTIDNQLKFDKHVNDICMKANKKLSVLCRMKSFLSSDKQHIMFKAFVESLCKYCPLVWLFQSRKCNTKINKIHEHALRIVYSDYESTFVTNLQFIYNSFIFTSNSM